MEDGRLGDGEDGDGDGDGEGEEFIFQLWSQRYPVPTALSHRRFY